MKQLATTAQSKGFVFEILERSEFNAIQSQKQHTKPSPRYAHLRVLRLSLKRPPFEVMVTGEKPWEFRQDSLWIRSRLFDKNGKPREYDLVEFVNGYGSDKPYFICKYIGFGFKPGVYGYSNGLRVRVGDNDFAIKLGEIIEIGNYDLPS